jgi:hypothetical protein
MRRAARAKLLSERAARDVIALSLLRTYVTNCVDPPKRAAAFATKYFDPKTAAGFEVHGWIANAHPH